MDAKVGVGRAASQYKDAENSEEAHINLDRSDINIGEKSELSQEKSLYVEKSKRPVQKRQPAYKQTEAFENHQKELPPFPKSYSSHPVNEIHMQVQGSFDLRSKDR